MVRSLTTRELRVVAAILEGLTKARTTNARMGIPTTPDVFTARFPNGFEAVVRWVAGLQSNDAQRQRVLERSARHRDGYLLDLGTAPDLENVVTLKDPQPAQRGKGRTDVQVVEIHGDPRDAYRARLNGLTPGRDGTSRA